MIVYPMPKTYYLTILGVDRNASLEEIRKAYRRKAKELHPDHNASVTAKDDFIRLTEAYHFLIFEKSGNTGVFGKGYKHRPPNVGSNDYQAWEKMMHDYIRQRAREYAEMEFRKFQKEFLMVQNSKYYPLFFIAYHIGAIIYILTAALFICLPIIIAVKMHNFLFLFALIPLSCGGVFLMLKFGKEQRFWSRFLRD